MTVESVTRTAERAQEAIAAIEGGEDRQLAAMIAQPGLELYESVRARIDERYADAERVQGDLAWVELYARAVPAATGFVLNRL